jgi:hypothetical protein
MFGKGDIMFGVKKAQMALLLDLHEELISKMDEQIRVEKEFINVLGNFFMFEQKLDNERRKEEQLDAAAKKVLANDRKY